MYGDIFKVVWSVAALFIACVASYQSFAQNFPPGITPPPDFDYSVIEFDELLSKKYGDDLIDYDKAVSGCMDLKGKAPQPEDMFYTEERLSVLEKCMRAKGYRFRDVNDFSIYKQLPSNKNLQDMLDAAEKLETSPSSSSPATAGEVIERAVQRNVPAEPKPVKEVEPTKVEEKSVPVKQPQKPKGQLPNRLFVPVE